MLKALQGPGFGAEWARGAVLIAEVIRPEYRGRKLGAVQSRWAVGWGAAVLLSALIFSLAPADLGWRLLFGVGLLPALLILFIRRGIAEPPRCAGQGPAEPLLAMMSGVFRRDVIRSTLIGGLFGSGLTAAMLPSRPSCQAFCARCATCRCSDRVHIWV